MSKNPKYDPFAVPDGYNPTGAPVEGYSDSLPPQAGEKKPLGKFWSNVLAFGGAIIALAILVYLPRILFPPKADKNPSVGMSFPVFKIEAMSENPDMLDLTSYQLVNKVSLIHLWGPWNPICSNELVPLNGVVKELSKSPQFQYISVVYPSNQIVGLESVRDEAGRKLLKIEPQTAADKKALRAQTFVLMDSLRIPKTNLYWDPAGTLAQSVYITQPPGNQQFFSFPTTLLVDGNKTIRAVWLGYTPGIENEILKAGKALTGFSSGNTTFSSGNTAITSENTATIPENTAITPENTAITPENTAITPENTAITSENTTVSPESTAMEADGDASGTAERTSVQ